MNAVLQARSQTCLEALTVLQEAYGGELHPFVMEPVFEGNQLVYVRFSICLPPEWQGDADRCMEAFDEAWSVPYGHTLPRIVFDYICEG
jgi:hypothetical protein